MNVAFRALVSRGCEILVVNQAPTEEAPFDGRGFAWIQNHHELGPSPAFREVLGTLEQFAPEVILSSWHVPLYQELCARLQGRAVRVGCGDNQWNATFRQQVSSFPCPLSASLFTFFFMPGRSGSRAGVIRWAFARSDWHGLYVCDCEASAKSPLAEA